MNHIGTKTIETERLILRRLTIGDAEDMFQWASNPETSKFLSWEPHESIDVTKELLIGWVAAYENLENYRWGIELKESGDIIGSTSVVQLNNRRSCCEIGYQLSPLYWNRGLMTESLVAVSRFLLHKVDAHRIECKHAVNNPASGRVMEKSGMIYEGELRDATIMKDGSYQNLAVWSLLKSDI
jgi:ribosomal-protein-alanine N-acetyltransferase